MSETLILTTGSRLHFGPLSYGTKTPPFFGGVGMMIDSPGFRIEFEPAERDRISGPAEYTSRAERLLRLCREHFRGPQELAGINITIHDVIPAHAGLGSGTQLSLAIARGIAILNTGETPAAKALAPVVDRGRRSAIGIHGFDSGGFLLDGGKISESEIGTLSARESTPREWRFVLITPTDGAGLAGADETAAFAKLQPMSSSVSDRLSRIAMTCLLPSVRNADFASFAESLFDFGKTVGEYFAPVQGGMIRHPAMLDLTNALRGDGVLGIAQSSWGPTICVAAENEVAANRLSEELAASPLCRDCHIHIARPKNTGAQLLASRERQRPE